MRRSFKSLHFVPSQGIFPISQALHAHRAYPKVYFDLSVDTTPVGRVVFQLFDNVAPRTCENFLKFATGKNSHNLSYTGSHFYRILPFRGIWGGEFEAKKYYSIYGSTFPDETYKIQHDKAGLLTTANANGVNTNDARFIITLGPAEWLNRNNVAFGEIIVGLDILKKIEKLGSQNGNPKSTVGITSCGELTGKEYEKYNKEEKFDIWAVHSHH